MRERVRAPAGVADPDSREERLGLGARGLPAQPAMDGDDLVDLVADRHDRVEAPAGILEDHAHAATAHPGTVALGQGQELDAIEDDPALDDRVLRQQPCQREERHALARPALPGEREDRAAIEAQVDAVDREHVADALLTRSEQDAQPADLEGRGARDRRDRSAQGRRRGARRFPTASPSRLTDSTASATAMPGTRTRYGAIRMTSRPSAIIPPQLTRFGSDSPRKASADSTRIAAPTVTPTRARTGCSAPGRMSLNAISSGWMPAMRAAST